MHKDPILLQYDTASLFNFLPTLSEQLPVSAL